MSGISSELEYYMLWAILGTSIFALLYVFILAGEILRHPKGTEKMQEIAKAIQEGAKAYLYRQFKTIAILLIFLTIILFLTAEEISLGIGRALAFLVGAIFSGATGFFGMSMAVRGNVRCANAARSSYRNALTIAFRTGSITGMLCVGLGLLGATTIYMIYGYKATEVLVGFGFGGCLLALFMRVGGGIYTKSADVGADLVGKVEKGIPEDDPRNAAVIADNVGDNVGDCAGMAADLFESYEVTLVASMILGTAAREPKWVIFPLIVRAVGVITSIIGTYLVKARSEEEHGMRPIQRSFVISTLLSSIGIYIAAKYYVQDIRLFWATLAGIFLAVFISLLTEYFTSTETRPVKEIARSTHTGPATTILSGLAVGMESSVWAIMLICLAIVGSFLIFPGDIAGALYGISLCGMGMLTTTGVIVSMDSYGPVTDNANGIAEMAGMEESAQAIMTRLDAVGNTTKAITKGFAIASAVVAAVSLFSSYIQESLYKMNINSIKINEPLVFVGLLIGGAIPFLFSSFTIRAVGRGAYNIVEEVRRQFREIPGLMEGKSKPEYYKCVDICVKEAQRELIGPAFLAICTPILIGFLLNAEALGGFLAGIILSGQLLAVFMANGGGAWDNAKKTIEHGLYGGKGSFCHKAAVIGDTVGDPLKDTSGPALNPLIKVMNLVALLIAPLLVKYPLVSEIGVNFNVIIILIITMIAMILAILRSKKQAFGTGS